MATGLLAGRWLAARQVRLWPALLLLTYVLWPQRAPSVALALLGLAALLWLLNGQPAPLAHRAAALADGATLLLALLVYAATASRDVLPADSGEFQLAAALLGIPHPPGYPLYTLAGHLFTRLLAATPAYGLNLMSALLAAGSLTLIGRATRRWAGQLDAAPSTALVAGLVAALALGTATTVWAQATIANIRMPTVFFAALALDALAGFATAPDRRRADRALLWLGLAIGLGLGHHPSLAFSALFWLLYLLLVDPRLALQPRRWLRPLLAGLLGLLPLAYIPIRGAMDAPLADPGLDTLSGFLDHVLARGFSGDMFAFANPVDLPHRLALLPTLFSFQFNALLLVAALLGLAALAWRNQRLLVLLAGSLLLHTVVTVTYRAPQTVEYLMPAYLPAVVAIGLVPAVVQHDRLRVSSTVTSNWHPVTRNALSALLLWAALLNGAAHAPSLIALAADTSTRQAVEPLLETAPPETLILADWHWATPLWVLQQVEGLRPDVEVRYVYPRAGQDYAQVWEEQVIAAADERPVLLTHFFEFAGYTSEPWGMGFMVSPRPVAAPQAPLQPLDVVFDGQLSLLGYRLGDDSFHAGEQVEFVLAWKPLRALDAAPSFTLRLVDEQGQDVGAQADCWLGSACAVDEVCFARLVLPLYPTFHPGHYQVTVGAYTVDASGFHTLPTQDGQPAAVLADLNLQPVNCHLESWISNLSTLHPHFLPFDGAATLIGVDYDRTVADTLRVYLHWRGPLAPGLQARLRAADGAEVTQPLPYLPSGACQTIAVDLPAATGARLRLALLDTAGNELRAGGPFGWPLVEVRLPNASANARYVLMGDEMLLTGVSARPAVPGETMVVDVALRGQRPLTSDDGISVRLVDGNGQRLAAHDSQPALGAMPTLKWIRGSRIADRHLLSIPLDLPAGEFQLALTAYDNFSLTPLLPLDSRLAGAVPLGSWTNDE